MAHYVDTSAFLKLVVREKHSAAFRKWAEERDDALFSCDLLRTEVLRTARRHSTAALKEARSRLDTITIVTVTTEMFERAAELDPAILRSLDALHLAAAMTVGDDLESIATYDDRLVDAATLHGLPVVSPM